MKSMRGIPGALTFGVLLALFLPIAVYGQDGSVQVDTIALQHTPKSGFVFDEDHPLWELGPGLYFLDRNNGHERIYGGHVATGLSVTAQMRVYKLADEVYPLVRLTAGILAGTYVEIGAGLTVADWLYFITTYGWYKHFDGGGGHSSTEYAVHPAFTVGFGFRYRGLFLDVCSVNWIGLQEVTESGYYSARYFDEVVDGLGMRVGWLF